MLQNRRPMDFDNFDELFPGFDSGEFIERTAKRMQEVGIDPAYVYAFRKTERLVHEGNWHLLSRKERAEWTRAVKEYRRSHPK